MPNVRCLASTVVPFVLALASGCSPSSSSGGSSESGPPGLVLSFEEATQAITEIEAAFELKLVLSIPAPDEVQLPFTLSGDATSFVDYSPSTPSPLTIPVGATKAAIVLQLHEDIFGELDEVARVTLQPPANASLGTLVQQELTIVDDDAAPFQESEPNDHYTSADWVGGMGEHFAHLVSGHTSPGLVDVFRFDQLVDGTVHVELDPQSADTYAVAQVLDANGALVHTFDDSKKGATVGGSFAVTANDTFYVVVAAYAAASGYALRVVGT